MQGTLQDLRYAARTLARSRAYTTVAVLTLALGIGANAAIFSVIHGILLKPLPFANGDRVVRLEQPVAAAGVEDAGFSVREIADLRARTRALDSIVEFHSMPFNLLGRGEPQRVQTGVVSAHFFDALGVRPLLGRTFRAGEDAPGSAPVVVLGYRFWRERLGGDSSVVGKTVEMTDRLHTVIGVLPPLPAFPNENDVFMPVSSCPFRSSAGWINNRNVRALTVFALLRPGTTLESARRDLLGVAAQMHAEHHESYPAGRGYSMSATGLLEELSGPARPTLAILLATSAFVLLTACANVSNLTLVRMVHRRPELVVRSALGAGRGRIARQLLTESAVVSLGGALLGLALAAALLQVLVPFAARFTPRAFEIGLHGPVLAFTVVVALVVGVASGTIPLVALTRDIAGGLRSRGVASGEGPRRARPERALVVAQVAVSVMLLTAAGLSVRSLIALSAVDAGYRPEQVATFRLTLSRERYAARDLRTQFADRFLASLRQQAGVTSVALAGAVPLSEDGRMTHGVIIEGRAAGTEEDAARAEMQVVSPDYFHAIATPLLAGRAFDERDRVETEPVVIINRSLARRHWKDANPVGARMSGDGGNGWARIVGVVGDVRDRALDEDPVDAFYLPYAQSPFNTANVLIRSAADPAVVTRHAIGALRAVDPEVPVDEIRTLSEIRLDSLAPRRLTTSLLSLFAGLALLIAATGIGGVLAFSVSQRTREIGVRLAIGAPRSQVLRMVLAQGGTMVALGLVLGAAGSVMLARYMAGVVFGITPRDPVTLAVVCLTLAVVGLLASLGPARRATAVDPVVALRDG